jgi:DnaK suppressor protein
VHISRSEVSVAPPTKREIELLKRTMLEQRKALLDSTRDELARWSEHPIGDIVGEVADTGDDSVAALVTDLDHTVVQRQLDAVRDIDAALARIMAGQYGICVDCGVEIEFERLSAFPTAKRCVDCQSRREKTYAHRETPTL